MIIASREEGNAAIHSRELARFARSTIPEESEGVLLVQETSKCLQLFSLAQNRLNFSQLPMFPSVEVDHRVQVAAILISYDKRKLARIHIVYGLLCDMVRLSKRTEDKLNYNVQSQTKIVGTLPPNTVFFSSGPSPRPPNVGYRS